MKFYSVMIISLLADIFIGLAFSVFHRPMPRDHSFHIFQIVFLSPFVVVSFLQLIKLVINMKSGYVVTGFGPGYGMFKWHFDRNMSWFLVGVFSELTIWSMLGFSVFRFLLKAK